MTKPLTVAKRIKRLREDLLDETQEQFAKRLGGIKPPTVTGWERGKRKYAPGPEGFLRLANAASNAGFQEEAVFFWTEAGIDIRAMSSGVAQILRQRGALIEGAEVFRVPRVRESKGRFTEVNGGIPLPRFVIPNPKSTIALDRTTLGGGLIVDTSTTDFTSLWGEAVLVDFSKVERALYSSLPNGHFVGTLIKEFIEEYPQGVWWAAELAPLTRWPYHFPVYLAGWRIPYPRKMKVGPEGLASTQLAQLKRETAGQAEKNLKLVPGARIIGRVFGWLWPPSGSGEKK